MSMNIENQSVELHPKINKFLVRGGIVLSIFYILYLLIFRFQLSILGMLILNLAYILAGLKYRIAPKYISLKWLNILTGIVGALSLIILYYDLIFNVLPNFKNAWNYKTRSKI